MKNLNDANIHKYRIEEDMESNDSGIFMIPIKKDNKIVRNLFVIIAKEEKWEHASISVLSSDGETQIERCPKWDEMKLIKELFWNDDEIVVQIHPKKTEYINIHEYVLHLWRKPGEDFEKVFEN